LRTFRFGTTVAPNALAAYRWKEIPRAALVGPQHESLFLGRCSQAMVMRNEATQMPAFHSKSLRDKTLQFDFLAVVLRSETSPSRGFAHVFGDVVWLGESFV
jgi:hypothetical protein